MLPVGSRGITAELGDLCSYNSLDISYEKNISVDLTKSGGPSCSCLITAEEKYVDIIKSLTDKPVEVLGRFY